MSEHCENCKFYREASTVFVGQLSGMDIVVNNLYCKRYPSYERREADDWCGEWQPKGESDE